MKFSGNHRSNFKTEMCKRWIQYGRCDYMEKCCFAHGYEELHNKIHNNINKYYKTKLC